MSSFVNLLCNKFWKVEILLDITCHLLQNFVMKFVTNDSSRQLAVAVVLYIMSINNQIASFFAARGWYIFIEASFPRQPNDTARIHSPAITSNPSQPKCLSFWYHMYGPHIGQLNIYTKVGAQFLGPVWSKSGTHGDQWWNGQIPLSNSNPYQIVFEGVRGVSYQGDIALDDIQISNGQCLATPNCDFESPIPQLQRCGWKQYPGDNFDWRRGQGATSSINTGPSNDHTLGDKRGKVLKHDCCETNAIH